MGIASAGAVADAYREVESVCDLDSARAKPWAAANDARLLDRILEGTDPATDRVLDFGCCGWPWITNYLRRAGYDVIGVDVTKSEWYEHDLVGRLGLDLVGYDGERLPFADGSFDLVLAFGVLEHVGVWKSPGEKYRDRTTEITAHRKRVLAEIRRVLAADGVLYVTKFPNVRGRDKLLAKVLGTDPGHLDSERGSPGYLRDLLAEDFRVEVMFADGLLPHRIPVSSPSMTIPWLYSRIDSGLSNAPILTRVAQNYCLLATPD